MKTVLEELAERLRLITTRSESGVFFPPSPTLQYTPQGIEAVNAAAGDIVRRYYINGEIVHGPTMNDIDIGNAPLDVLAMLPLLDQEISEYGTYAIYRRGLYIGNVTYRGWPEQDRPGIAIIGATTDFTPAEKMEKIEFTFTLDEKDGENT